MQAVGILVWVWSVVGRSVGPLSKRRLLNFPEIVRRMSDFFMNLDAFNVNLLLRFAAKAAHRL